MVLRQCSFCVKSSVRRLESRYCQECWDRFAEGRTQQRKCFTCGKRPATGDIDQTECKQCWQRRQQEKEAEESKLSAWHTTADFFVLYKSNVLALYQIPKARDDDGEPKCRVEPIYRSLNSIPEFKLVDLNVYQPGFTREQVKKWKKLFRQHFG